MLKKILHWKLRLFSRLIIKKYHPEIVGITGSVGKTSTKENTTTILSARFNVRSSVKNYNNEIGMPLAIIGIDKTPGSSILGWMKVFFVAVKLLIKKDPHYPEILVLEMGADKPGDIRYLTEIAPCIVGVLTFISHAHTEFFKTIKKIAQEKKQIITHLNSDGLAVLNFDNEIVVQQATSTKAEVLTYGLKEGADLRATDINIIYDETTGWPKGLNFKVSYKGSMIPAFLPGFVAEHLISSALAGLCVGIYFGLNLVEGIETLKKQKPMPGHMCLIPGIKNTLINDDTYNSSPAPAESALNTLKQITLKPGARRYAVLGDMLELGPETENSHRAIGFKVAESGVDFLITVGEASKNTAAAAIEAGMDRDHTASFGNSGEVRRFLQEKIKTNDVILVKGSQGLRMEKIVKEIMAEPLDAPTLLVRQDGKWLEA